MRRARLASAIGVMALAGCADLATEPERIPTALGLDRDTVTFTEGHTASIVATVLDQHGDPLDVPAWATPRWSVSSATIAATDGTTLQAVGPGQTIASVEVAGLTTSAVLRVNPAAIALSVDSVTLLQQGSPASILTEGHDATVRVFLRADKPNFFAAAVRVNVWRDGAVVGSIDGTSTAAAVPHQASASAAWTAVIPAQMVREGNAIEVVVDPDGALPHSAASERRHPADGYLAMRFAITVRVAGVELTQSVQRADGSVPLVAGRDALLRIYATSPDDIVHYPTVRATFYRGGVEAASYDVRRYRSSFPREVERGVLSSSWNVLVPGTLMTAGTSFVIEIDPEGEVPRTAESETRYPASGTHPIELVPVPPLWVRMIPVHQTAFGTTGRVSESNLRNYSRPLLGKYPIADSDIDIRTVYSTDARLDTYDGWSQLLSEIAALRNADSSGRYYYGVVTHPGTQGTPGGLGYVGWPAAVGYDLMPYGGETFAHELGHNFGLPHAPCGGPAGVDPDFPYPDGGIGEWGYDVFADRLIDPAHGKDLMSYCSPEWISDYNYLKVLANREEWDWTTTGPDAAGEAGPALLIWGGVRGGRLVLEPAFELEMRSSLPAEEGRYRVEGLDAAGLVIFSYAFTPERVDHRAGDASFAFAVPSRIARPDRLATIRLTGPEGVAVRSRTDDPAGRRPRLALQEAGGHATVSWSAAEHPMALVRDASTGEILSFARGGHTRLAIPARPLEVLLSDGVRTVRPEIR